MQRNIMRCNALRYDTIRYDAIRYERAYRLFHLREIDVGLRLIDGEFHGVRQNRADCYSYTGKCPRAGISAEGYRTVGIEVYDE